MPTDLDDLSSTNDLLAFYIHLRFAPDCVWKGICPFFHWILKHNHAFVLGTRMFLHPIIPCSAWADESILLYH